MNRHLSSQDVCAWLSGNHTPELQQHVLGCAVCQAELDRLGQALTQFRGTVRQWSEQQHNGEVKLTASAGGWRHLRWACAAMAACLLVSVSVIWRGNQPPAGGATAADAALLAQVDQQVSRAVPSPMEPLMNLVSWEGAGSTETGTVKTK
ncbi:MAG: hypothetical protein HYX25_01390 [Candidatus Solibacter usitatus]|nr:hypothetical protein [Candidatus Solibacter usitatus]